MDILQGHEPTPSRVVSSKEEWRKFLESQPLVHRRIFLLLYQGKTQQEIAEQMRLDKGYVSRVVHKLSRGPGA
jgi:DNA-binding MarR family transcriptional regulator